MPQTYPFKHTIISGSSCTDASEEFKNRKKRFRLDKDSYRYVLGPDSGTAMLCTKCGKVSFKCTLI